MAFPLALYLIGRAQTCLRAQLWGVAAAICAMGAVATISRTTVIMVVAILAVGLWVRGRQVFRFWRFSSSSRSPSTSRCQVRSEASTGLSTHSRA
jgi:hypothetical protein